jgi:uncharacterized protein (DUF885 family)
MRRRDFTLALASAPLAALAQPADAEETRKLHDLFERQWEDSARRFPEDSTVRGDLRFNDQLEDLSPAARAALDRINLQWLAEARAIRRERLGAVDRVSLDLFIARVQRWVERQSFPGLRSLLIGNFGGAQSEFADLVQQAPVRSTQQVEQLIARMHALPRKIGQQVAMMREGMAVGWVSARPVLEAALRQIDVQLAADIESGPYFVAFKKIGADVPATDQARLRAQARAAIESQVLPAMRQLRAFIVDEYLPKAPASGALVNYPDGPRAYDMLARHSTTTSLGAAQIHAIGQRELARLRAEMEEVMRGTGFGGDFAAFVQHLYTDPKFFHTSPDALLAGYREIAKRLDAELPRLFAELPRAPYGVRAMPAFRGPDAAESYEGPALDGSRGGWFNANILGYKTRPIWGMATLTAHEAVPGHHLQIARAQELKDLPKFRRSGGYTAFGEGWAVYAETLGREVGLYDNPYSLFGHLQWQAFRAARLVVDTGIHGQGWSRDRAIDFMVERTGMHRTFVTSEVDRYTSWPGQALGYMIGKMKFDELRARARARLGPKFDVRKFHNAVLDNGALPLDVLERLVDEWIARQ